MNNTEKKLDALIDALGFDVEAVSVGNYELIKAKGLRPEIVQEVFNCKLTKRKEKLLMTFKEYEKYVINNGIL